MRAFCRRQNDSNTRPSRAIRKEYIRAQRDVAQRTPRGASARRVHEWRWYQRVLRDSVAAGTRTVCGMRLKRVRLMTKRKGDDKGGRVGRSHDRPRPNSPKLATAWREADHARAARRERNRYFDKGLSAGDQNNRSAWGATRCELLVRGAKMELKPKSREKRTLPLDRSLPRPELALLQRRGFAPQETIAKARWEQL